MRIEGGAGIVVTGDQYLPTYLPNKNESPTGEPSGHSPALYASQSRVCSMATPQSVYLSVMGCWQLFESVGLGLFLLLAYRKDGVDPCCSPTSLLFPCVHDTAHQGRSRIRYYAV